MILSDIPPFRIAGNLYFVGSYAASSHLIDTGDGLILIDTGYEKDADAVCASIEELGFSVSDIKYIIHSHGHLDHSGATAAILSRCKAITAIGRADVKYLGGAFIPDIYIKDGDVLSLGNTDLLFLETPGHTEGTVSIFFYVEENGKRYRVGSFGGAGTKQIRKGFLRERELSYAQRGMFFESIERLKGEKVDIFMGNHSWQNKTREGREQMLRDPTVNPFIDETRWVAFLEKLERNMERIMQEESRTEFINYAHRGASEYAPENTMSSFLLGIEMGANGIETDVRFTKDKVPVLFHDDTLLRVTGDPGRASDLTLSELKELYCTNGDKKDRIATLDEFLTALADKPISFAIELKQEGAADAVADAIEKYGIAKKTVVTSFKYNELLRMRSIAPNIKCGYLTKRVDDHLLRKLREDGIEEICPRADLVNAENVRKWHRLGLNVRAWGVKTPELMESVYNAGADGMTVNFPDKLTELIASANE